MKPEEQGGTGPPIRVLLLDDCGITRSGLRAILTSYPDITVGAEVETICDAVDTICAATTEAPDVVLANTLAGALDPLVITRRLGGECPKWAGRVLVIVSQDSVVDAPSGTIGTLLKSATPHEMVLALRMVAAGYSLFPSGEHPRTPPAVIDRAQLATLPELPGPGRLEAEPRLTLGPDPIQTLTRREREVLGLLARGCSNAEIAANLVLSESTVKSHVQHLLNKLGMRNRAAAAIYAYQAGVVHPGAQV